MEFTIGGLRRAITIRQVVYYNLNELLLASQLLSSQSLADETLNTTNLEQPNVT